MGHGSKLNNIEPWVLFKLVIDFMGMNQTCTLVSSENVQHPHSGCDMKPGVPEVGSGLKSSRGLVLLSPWNTRSERHGS